MLSLLRKVKSNSIKSAHPRFSQEKIWESEANRLAKLNEVCNFSRSRYTAKRRHQSKGFSEISMRDAPERQ